MDSSSSVWWYGCKEGFSYRGTSRLNLVVETRAVAHLEMFINRNKMEFVVVCSRRFLRFQMQEQWQRPCFRSCCSGWTFLRYHSLKNRDERYPNAHKYL